jgi:hypothetical protein
MKQVVVDGLLFDPGVLSYLALFKSMYLSLKC